MRLPNIRKLFAPDPGYVLGDADLDRADLQVVVWEAQDDELKAMLREGVDVHAENAKTLMCSRAMAKAFVHGTNYGGSEVTMARNCGVTIHQARNMQNRWFAAHPGIKKWHDRVAISLQQHRAVWNAFGFRRVFFDRIQQLLPQALAWIPQSTVALVTNQGWENLEVQVPEVQVLLQVHDSLVFQYPERLDPALRPRIRAALEVPIPYPEPLTIPVGLKVSRSSWGECREVSWEGNNGRLTG